MALVLDMPHHTEFMLRDHGTKADLREQAAAILRLIGSDIAHSLSHHYLYFLNSDAIALQKAHFICKSLVFDR